MTLARRRVYQLLQVSDQILQLRHLDVTLDHVARIEMTNGIDELLECIIVLFLFIEIVSMLFGYLGNDLLRELGGLRYLLRFSE